MTSKRKAFRASEMPAGGAVPSVRPGFTDDQVRPGSPAATSPATADDACDPLIRAAIKRFPKTLAYLAK